MADRSCLFCCEEESVKHLFFDCCVAKLTWELILEVVGTSVGADFESIGRWWISNNKNAVLNCTCAATLWSLWKLRNHLCFQWQGGGQVLCSIARMPRRQNWITLHNACWRREAVRRGSYGTSLHSNKRQVRINLLGITPRWPSSMLLRQCRRRLTCVRLL